MGIHSQQTELIRRYLLGQLSEEDCERLESTYFEQTEVFLDLLEAKERLIDQYLRGELAPEERSLFERRFYSNDSLRREVEVQQAARNFSPRNPGEPPQPAPLPGAVAGWRNWLPAPGRGGTLAWGAAASLLLLTAIGLSSLLRPPAQEKEIAGTGRPPSSLPSPDGPLVTREIDLTATDGARAGGGSDNYKLDLDPSISHARLRLRLEGKLYPSYHSDLLKKDEGRRVVATNEALTPETAGNIPVIVWTLGTNQLPTGDYLIEVQGIPEKGERAPAGNYDLTVRWR